MIKVQNLTPEVYYKHSRDFQLIGRLYDIILNSSKTNADRLYNFPLSDNSDTKLMDLMALTLGFKSRHNYNINQLTALCSTFVEVIRNKGNIISIIKAGNTLLNSEGITEAIDYEVSEDKKSINIFLPEGLTDINLFKDLLNYILPAGMSCNIIKKNRIKESSYSEVETSDEIKWKWTGEESELENVALSKWIYTKDGIDGKAKEATAKDTSGIIANSFVWRPTATTKNKKEK